MPTERRYKVEVRRTAQVRQYEPFEVVVGEEGLCGPDEDPAEVRARLEPGMVAEALSLVEQVRAGHLGPIGPVRSAGNTADSPTHPVGTPVPREYADRVRPDDRPAADNPGPDMEVWYNWGKPVSLKGRMVSSLNAAELDQLTRSRFYQTGKSYYGRSEAEIPQDDRDKFDLARAVDHHRARLGV